MKRSRQNEVIRPITLIVQVAVRASHDPLTRALRRLPVAVLRASSLAVRPQAGLARLRDRFERAGALVFASGNGVRALAPVARDWRWPSCLIAQGPGTAAVLAEFGRVAQVPASPYDSEAVLAMPVWNEWVGQAVLRVSGEDGRELLVDGLRARGIDAEAIAVYRREPVPLPSRQIQVLRSSAGRKLLLFTSGEALLAFRQQLEGDWSSLADADVLVPSARLEHLARELGFERLHRAESAARGHMLAAVRDMIALPKGGSNE
ncbi:MAG: uroporphyrinogen-III synthase [Ahniella sp.]|nr:uroporphyrinogen-III synthase [Ahniella sp.]